MPKERAVMTTKRTIMMTAMAWFCCIVKMGWVCFWGRLGRSEKLCDGCGELKDAMRVKVDHKLMAIAIRSSNRRWYMEIV